MLSIIYFYLMAKWNSHFMWWSQLLTKSIEKAVSLMRDGIGNKIFQWSCIELMINFGIPI